MGSVCSSTAVVLTSCVREIVGSNPPSAMLFSDLLYPISSLSLTRSFTEVQNYSFSYKNMLSRAAQGE